MPNLRAKVKKVAGLSTLTLSFSLFLASALAASRIKDRVAAGGHDVPLLDVKRRFTRGLYNFLKYYKPLSDTWLLFNNADAIPCLIAKERNGKTEVVDKELFEKIMKPVR
jgi:predicted ABC-type ATPase